MEEKYKKVKELVEKYGQEHVLQYYDKLEETGKQKLLDQILAIDFDLNQMLYQKAIQKEQMEEDKIEPIAHLKKEELTKQEQERNNKIGEQAIKEGTYAVVTMAGGQGTRLGHQGPKGTFDLGLKNHKSLFEIYCDQLKDAKEKYGVAISWYIMTSKENNQETVEFFNSHNYFDYPKEKIHFFKQGQIPMVDTKGNILITEEGFIKEAADGHGGVLAAMGKEGVISQMKKDGIKWVTIVGVDNVLVKMVDPFMLGITIEKNYLAASKSIEKTDPAEKVGVFCKRNGRPSIVEYIEISEEMANSRNEQGGLLYGDLNPIYHLFHLEALEQIINQKLPYHVAFKKANYLDAKGNWIIPEEPNAYKFETFIFDSFAMLEDMLIVRTKRQEDFAPIKNKEGKDSPQTARELYKAYFGIKE